MILTTGLQILIHVIFIHYFDVHLVMISIQNMWTNTILGAYGQKSQSGSLDHHLKVYNTVMTVPYWFDDINCGSSDQMLPLLINFEWSKSDDLDQGWNDLSCNIHQRPLDDKNLMIPTINWRLKKKTKTIDWQIKHVIIPSWYLMVTEWWSSIMDSSTKKMFLDTARISVLKSYARWWTTEV